MEEYKIKGGYTLSEAEIEALGDACDRGEVPGEPGEWVVRPVGRPALHPSEELAIIAFKLPVSLRAEIEKRARDCDCTLSQYMRDMVDRDLVSA
ncbi:MAG: hypothetical protein FWE46_04710 [Coriobacteriia bacterium]|nr:hypothetical protein [Coriobacteriia bacterium]MCL2537621.1 hypothetical protein [Coriobacteriia bacterium]